MGGSFFASLLLGFGWLQPPEPGHNSSFHLPWRIENEPFEVLGIEVTPIPLIHGRFRVLGYRFGGVAYCTDTNEIPPSSMDRLQNLDTLIIDCLRREPHIAHLSLDGDHGP